MWNAIPLALLMLATLLGGGAAGAAENVAAATPLPEIGEDTTLEALTRPDRFAWPARFTCRTDPRRPEAVVVVGRSFDELNGTLAAAELMLEDCRGGFALESLTQELGKLGRIVGEAAGDDI
jgi:hypothetical protein